MWVEAGRRYFDCDVEFINQNKSTTGKSMKQNTVNPKSSSEIAKLNPFTLAFNGDLKHLENTYLSVYHKKSIKQQRFIFILSIFAYGVFAWLDIVAVPEKANLFWAIRFAYYTPLVLLILLFSYTKHYSAYSQIIIALFSFFGCAGLIAIHTISSQYGFYSYRYAIILVLFFVIYLLRLRFLYVLATGLAIMAVYNIVQWQMGVFPPDIHLDSNILYGFILLLGSIFIYYFERLDRNQFYLNKLLEEESEKVYEANQMLEEKIAERTQELIYLSYHDQLTDLHNRRYYEEQLKLMDKTSNLPFCIIMIDVNGLKLINDSLGHAVGDELLRKVAIVLKNGTEKNAVVSRLGGDEFSVLLPKTNQEKAENYINRIRELASRESIKSLDISLSYGYAIKEDSNELIEVILKLAEDTMYRKKLYERPSMRSKAIDMIIRTLYEKNRREEEHSRRVAVIAQALGEAAEMSSENVKELETIGFLHDIGKIAIDENVLNKQGPLTDIEYDHIKLHPEIGYRILNTAYEMSDMADYVLSHHEFWNGNGYPRGIRGEDIPIQSRIIGIADAYDAMTSERPYRVAKSTDFAIEQLEKNAGIQFDPKLVRIFVDKVLKYNRNI
jgi:diguanylate cyclase (GGDEF)-like protein